VKVRRSQGAAVDGPNRKIDRAASRKPLTTFQAGVAGGIESIVDGRAN